MSELGAFWPLIRQRMGEGKHWREATRHEDSSSAGIADVSYVSKEGQHGWIELKKLDAWPVYETTPLRIDHYSDFQRIFLKRKGRRGGYCWILVQVARDYFLLDWLVAQDLGRMCRAEIEEKAAGFWKGRMDWKQLGDLLCERGPRWEDRSRK